ncbi:cation transporting ATPase C-terminal domain-containing protein (plasmid) [Acaryochloris marina S15]|nr:cation transporting ATPase C-terminal domain-containing protein [Acaryochloris marina S15]
MTTVCQLFVLYVPFLQTFFDVQAFEWLELLICLGFSTLMFVWIELRSGVSLVASSRVEQ